MSSYHHTQNESQNKDFGHEVLSQKLDESEKGQLEEKDDYKFSDHNKSSMDQDKKYLSSPRNFETSASVTKNKQKVNGLMVQNKRLRINNKQLKRQLQMFQKRLDETLKKRTVSQKKPRVSREVVQGMELKNAYKQCQIYKREIQNLKKKQALFNEEQFNSLTNQVAGFQKQKQKLLQQIKGLKKVNKQQQKGLVELAGTNFAKIAKEYEQIKQENKRLHERLAKEDRQVAYSRIASNNQRRKMRQEQQKSNQNRRKEEEKQNSQLQILKSKVDKESRKIIYLTSQNNRLVGVCQQLKSKVEQKQKQIIALRLRIGALRKQARSKKLETQPSFTEQNSKNGTKMKKIDSKRRINLKSEMDVLTERISIQQESGKKYFGKYPRLQQAGIKMQGSYKWNHHQFSSKIKQLTVCSNTLGYISQINFRYEKGQPNEGNMKENTICTHFMCEQNTGQYVKVLKGGFKDGLLLYLIVKTSKGRIKNFSQYEKQQLCSNFTFGQGQNQFPGALFGQNSTEGINRIGCLIQCLK